MARGRFLDVRLGEQFEPRIEHGQAAVMLADDAFDHDVATSVESGVVASSEKHDRHRSRPVDDGALEGGDTGTRLDSQRMNAAGNGDAPSMFSRLDR